MCCFSGPVKVHGTHIFARTDGNGWQGIAYQMTYHSRDPVAMVLPIPHAPVTNGENGGEPVRFVDLSSYEDFFPSLERAFPVTMASALDDDVPAQVPPASTALRVEHVGAFVASFVPSTADFARLDPRFRMDDDVWKALPYYRDWGFAVFQLAERGGKVHPMAFVFRTREPQRIFFPTVHVHDGAVAPKAVFDHTLYAQSDRAPLDWRVSEGPARDYVDIERAQRLVRSTAHMQRLRVFGKKPNEDIWLDA